MSFTASAPGASRCWFCVWHRARNSYLFSRFASPGRRGCVPAGCRRRWDCGCQLQDSMREWLCFLWFPPRWPPQVGLGDLEEKQWIHLSTDRYNPSQDIVFPMWFSSNDGIILMKYILSNENRQQKLMGYKLFSRISVGNLIMYYIFSDTLCPEATFN